MAHTQRPGLTPNDYLRELLLELADEHNLTDSEIARAHHRHYPDSTLGQPTVSRFRTADVRDGTPPSPMMEEAIAAATGTTREANWEEAFRRWRAATKLAATQTVRARSARRQSA